MITRLTIPFRLHGHSGLVSVRSQINKDPQRWGNTLLGEPKPPLKRANIGRGFPLCHATVSYEGEGYAACMGWIQVLRFSGTGPGTLVDQAPQMKHSRVPFASWGPCPAFFDSPHTDTPGIDWTAHTFLVASPDTVMTRTVQLVCGFSWGWSTSAKGPPTAKPLTRVGPRAWSAACAILRPRYPDWKFLDD